jgi:DNA-binding MarR family transcriptional regulator
MADNAQISQTLQDWSEVFLHHSMREFKQLMDENGLSPSQVITIFRLYRGKRCGVSAIGSQLGISNAASSQLIDRLVIQGLIERTEDPADRRAKDLTLTRKGKTLVEHVIAGRRRWLEGLTTELTQEQQATVIADLSLLTQRASQIGEK